MKIQETEYTRNRRELYGDTRRANDLRVHIFDVEAYQIWRLMVPSNFIFVAVCECASFFFARMKRTSIEGVSVAVTHSTSSRDFDFNLVGQLSARAFFPSSLRILSSLYMTLCRLFLSTKNTELPWVQSPFQESHKPMRNTSKSVQTSEIKSYSICIGNAWVFRPFWQTFFLFLIKIDFFRNRIERK